MKLKGKSALVTGGAQGIGGAVASLFASEGANVSIVDLDGDNAAAKAQELKGSGGKVISKAADVSEEDQIKGAIEETAAEFGQLDILVNNAGIVGRSTKLVRVNLLGVYYGCKAAIPMMVAQGGGVIVNTASNQGIYPPLSAPFLQLMELLKQNADTIPDQVIEDVAAEPNPYAACKRGVIELARYYGVKYGRKNVRANCVAPGFTRTPLVRMAWENEAPRNMLFNATPMGRLAEPEEMARPYLFLASDDSSFITGETLVVDGGAVSMGAPGTPWSPQWWAPVVPAARGWTAPPGPLNPYDLA
ncbi:MAG TPA: SDR family NAD(P)-dependent oxidoreductase [Dehalococcoidia bacterium]|nr:SDR family NAD(P)-dependent oxidoreductase [Dehalococcoidia bacterium]